ncbi:MAG: tetratricopeptide repeat protein [Proteobacteria bacterium]|nr:MAG: tetratricopeptide repeat protein [Pseudomonadota bacterium]
MLSPKRRHLAEIHDKVTIYLRLQRFQAAEELVRSALNEMGPYPNLLNLLGVIFHRQSLFSQAIEYFEQSIASNPRFLEAALNLSATYADLGFYDQAEKVYEDAITLFQDDKVLPDLVLGRLANLHNATAIGYEQAGLLEEATQEFQKALSIYPRMPDVRLKLAKIYLHMELYQSSKDQLLQILGENPSHVESLNLIGSVCYRMGDADEASRYWQKSQNLNPHDKTSKTYIRSMARQQTGRGLRDSGF